MPQDYPPIQRMDSQYNDYQQTKSRENLVPALPQQYAQQYAPSAPAGIKIANPGPLGLCAFATTTFLLSLFNVNARGITVPNAIVGMALAYGGFAQLLAGMWEFVCGNTFGATAFTSYGAFWISFGIIFLPDSGILAAYTATPATLAQLDDVLGCYLAVWFAVTVIFLIASHRTTVALMSLFTLLSITFFILMLGKFIADPTTSTNVTRVGGYFGIATALNAWYCCLAGMLEQEGASHFRLPIGKRP
jgi:succinate-acetate transporter protein